MYATAGRHRGGQFDRVLKKVEEEHQFFVETVEYRTHFQSYKPFIKKDLGNNRG